MGGTCNKLPDQDEYTKDIQEAVGGAIATFPSAYMNERKHIVEMMQAAAPEPYKNLLYRDYPDKNGSKVNELALINVTSDEAKKKIANQINELIKPKVDEKTGNMNPLVAAAFRKTIEKAVDESVNAAVNTFMKNFDKNDAQGKAKA